MRAAMRTASVETHGVLIDLGLDFRSGRIKLERIPPQMLSQCLSDPAAAGIVGAEKGCLCFPHSVNFPLVLLANLTSGSITGTSVSTPTVVARAAGFAAVPTGKNLFQIFVTKFLPASLIVK